MKNAHALAVDLGASSGRVIAGALHEGHIAWKVVHRFDNEPISEGGTLYWDFEKLWSDIVEGLTAGAGYVRDLQGEVSSIGVDTWGVDFGLLDARGELMGRPVHYRDGRTAEIAPARAREWGRDFIFAESGCQYLPFNTLYQLAALKKNSPNIFETARGMLFMPDLINYFLTGWRVTEFTIASTSQMIHPTTRDWSDELIAKLQIPPAFFQKPKMPGFHIGVLKPELRKSTKLDRAAVIVVGGHDTASAVVAVPAQEEDFLYVSSGTWSLVGTEVSQPILSAEALEGNFTNEGGVEGTYRFLKNVMGLWLLQECRRHWLEEGSVPEWEELLREMEGVPTFTSLIDPDDEIFLPPGDMPGRIAAWCEAHGQAVPVSRGEFVRCIVDSLAMKTAEVVKMIEAMTGKHYRCIHVVGGGCQNWALNQAISDVCEKQVVAGPIEATALGNLGMQWIAKGDLKDLRALRTAVRDSVELVDYFPRGLPQEFAEKRDWFRGIVR